MAACELCEREVPRRTKHHLIPRTRHRNKRNKKRFARDDVRSRIAMLCPACHRQLHALFSEKVLERELNTLALLRAHPDVATFVAWLRKQPTDRKVGVRRSKRRR